MSDPQLAAVIAAFGGSFAAIIGAVAAVVAAHIGHRNADSIQELHIELDGRLTQLLYATKKAGQIEERDNQRHQVEIHGQPEGDTLP